MPTLCRGGRLEVALLIGLVFVVLVVVQRRGSELFVLSVRDGQVLVVRGAVPIRLLGIDLDDSTTFLDNGYDSDSNGVAEADSLKLISCQGVPLTAAKCTHWTNEWGVTACTDTSMASYITARDWLEDVVNGADPDGCTGSLEYRSTEFDWLRFWWDMRNSGTGQGIGTTQLINLLDNMNPRSWDPDDNAVGSDGLTSTIDDVTQRLIVASQATICVSPSTTCQAAVAAEKNNGQDH